MKLAKVKPSNGQTFAEAYDEEAGQEAQAESIPAERFRSLDSRAVFVGLSRFGVQSPPLSSGALVQECSTRRGCPPCRASVAICQ